MTEAFEKVPQPLLARAARSIAETMGLADTLVDVLRARAFQPFAEGLRQYLIIRLASPEEGAQAFQELRIAVAALDKSELFEPPGVRARLYSIARELATQHWDAGGGGAGGLSRLPWRPPSAHATDRYLLALQQIRRELPATESELLELHFARELVPEEIAHVLAMPKERVIVQLRMAMTQVKRLVSPLVGEGADLDTLLLEAFAIESAPSAGEARHSIRPEPLTLGTVLGGRYEIQAQVGSGGMGNVYRANDTEVPGHVVAVKMLHEPARSESARQAALRELHLIASVFHPSVVVFKDHGWYDDRLWFVMPWYEGESLKARIARAPLTRAEARPIFEQLALALAAMHAVGIRHQDIKPDNILLAEIPGLVIDGESSPLPVLIDLGVAAKEAELVLAGTPIYFAPEVAAQYARVEEPHPVTSAADVFSLCLSLRNALEPDTVEDVAAGAVERFIEHRAAHSPPPPSSKDLRFLRGHFERWLDVDPTKRPSAKELAAELKVLTRPEDRRARRLRMLRWLVPMVVTIAAIFGSVVYGLNRQAAIQRLEAAQARLEAAQARNEADQAMDSMAGMQQDLDQAAERQQALEADVAQTLKRYQSSELTREQLTGKLARAEGQARMYQSELVDERQRTRTLQGELEAARGENTRIAGELATTRGRLEDERLRAADLEGAVSDLQAQLERARNQAHDAESRLAELTAQVSALEARVASAVAEAREYASNLTAARTARDQAQAALEEARRRLGALERRPTPPRPIPRLEGVPDPSGAEHPAPGPGDAGP